MGDRFHGALQPIVDRTPWITELRGRGLMWAVELCHDGGIEPDRERTTQLLEACKTHGLLVGKGGLYGNVIRLAPMLNITADETDELIARFSNAIDDVGSLTT